MSLRMLMTSYVLWALVEMHYIVLGNGWTLLGGEVRGKDGQTRLLCVSEIRCLSRLFVLRSLSLKV